MNHDLALKLKNAGFPQDGYGIYSNYCLREELKNGGVLPEVEVTMIEKIYKPTLEELIRECGDEFYSLQKITAHELWRAEIVTDTPFESVKYKEASTPEEAVANLWLEINKSKIEKANICDD